MSTCIVHKTLEHALYWLIVVVCQDKFGADVCFTVRTQSNN